MDAGANDSIFMSIPRNLRLLWPYPNLLHFGKYVDLLTISSQTDRTNYNKAIIYVQQGYVLLKYRFFCLRWGMSYKSCRSFFNVLTISGWVKIKQMSCRSISNRKIVAPLITFPKIGYVNGCIIVDTSKWITKKGSGFSLTDNDIANMVGSGSETGRETYREDSREDSRETYREDSRETYREDSKGSGFSLTDNDLTDIEGSGSEIGSEDGIPPLIYIEEEERINKEKNNKKERTRLSLSLDIINQFAITHDIVDFDLRGWFNYYEAEGWKDKEGRMIHNWQRLLIHAYRDPKSKFHFKNKNYGTTKPTIDDRLARQGAELAQYYAERIGAQTP